MICGADYPDKPPQVRSPCRRLHTNKTQGTLRGSCQMNSSAEVVYFEWHRVLQSCLLFLYSILHASTSHVRVSAGVILLLLLLSFLVYTFPSRSLSRTHSLARSPRFLLSGCFCVAVGENKKNCVHLHGGEHTCTHNSCARHLLATISSFAKHSLGKSKKPHVVCTCWIVQLF